MKSSEAIFGTEERFAWQNAKFASDVAYNLPEGKPSKSVVFGNSLRTGDDSNPDAKKSSTGPGSYDTSHSLEFNSEHATSRMTRFGAAPRQSMAMKTPSPGAVYNIEQLFWNGPEKGIAIGFNCDHRPPLYGNSAGSNADMFVPKSSTGVAITIASRFKQKNPGRGTPGAIYDVHVSMTKSVYTITTKFLIQCAFFYFKFV